MQQEKFHFYALWLCLVCIIVYILQYLYSGLTDNLALTSGAIYNLEIWRFLTSMFAHGSFSHLLFNMFALALFGSILEKKISGNLFLIIFFGSGIFANLIAVNFYESSLGASGAIYGILGCLIIISPTMVVWLYGLPMPMFIAGLVWIGAGIIGLFIPSNTGHIAHLSGIAVGLVFGIVLRIIQYRNYKNEIKDKPIKIEIPQDYIRNWEDKWMK